MTQLISMLISVVLGSVFVINGVILKADDIIASATSAVNGANVHQFATVLELYYSDHESYPTVSGGEALVNLLEEEQYIRNRPLDPAVFTYESKNGGQEYLLAIAK